ncbi:hypothetical protein DD238_006314 [Peronospora effusa]|uniref:Uncharacterized protein n=1 Tax=Peronospora effusa TaxID=542832 RepID=A0A3M6VCQ6_9STRA|nr:hypothetical protein DD238_006314 [Peronospora effusa]RQM14108.1 hypothetical protein DD237_003605 [Peronospora effusa]
MLHECTGKRGVFRVPRGGSFPNGPPSAQVSKKTKTTAKGHQGKTGEAAVGPERLDYAASRAGSGAAAKRQDHQVRDGAGMTKSTNRVHRRKTERRRREQRDHVVAEPAKKVNGGGRGEPPKMKPSVAADVRAWRATLGLSES